MAKSTASRNPALKGYQAVKFNAISHGILSRHVVLPHEDKDEFNQLLNSLISEHQPNGPTEMHLVEELACIIWRKRRVLQAEYVDVNRSLARSARTAAAVLNAALPFQKNLWDPDTDLEAIITMSANDARESANDAMAELSQIHDMMMCLQDQSDNSYHKGIHALPEEWLPVWKEYVSETVCPENSDSLRLFVNQRMIPTMISLYRMGKHHEAVKAQAHGEGLQADQLEKLVRYESHLDRKLERILAMLLKLKEIRAGSSPDN